MERIYGLDSLSRVRHNLIDEQHDTLIEAIECGYYDIPRETNLEEFSDRLGLSHQAVSERVRRGVKNLVTSALLVEEDDEER